MLRAAVFALLYISIAGCAVNEPRPQVFRPEYPMATYVTVPGWLADWGDDGSGHLAEVEEDLRNRGFPVLRAQTRTRNSQQQNATIIYRLLQSIPGDVIIACVSRGCAETALAVSWMPEDDQARIRSIITVSSAHGGSLVANYYSNPILYAGTALWSNVCGWGPMRNIIEMRVERARALFATVMPKIVNVPKVSVVTTTSDISKFGSFKKFAFTILESTGEPHDGLILARDQIMPGARAIYRHGQRHGLDPGRQVEAMDLAIAMVPR
jgi:hypothetical protein